jgi:hypothetical protein
MNSKYTVSLCALVFTGTADCLDWSGSIQVGKGSKKYVTTPRVSHRVLTSIKDQDYTVTSQAEDLPLQAPLPTEHAVTLELTAAAPSGAATSATTDGSIHCNRHIASPPRDHSLP